MNIYRRFVLVCRDAGRANSALANLHRCIAKLEERVEKLPTSSDTEFNMAMDLVQMNLKSTKYALGQCLARLDEVQAAQQAEYKRRVKKRESR